MRLDEGEVQIVLAQPARALRTLPSARNAIASIVLDGRSQTFTPRKISRSSVRPMQRCAYPCGHRRRVRPDYHAVARAKRTSGTHSRSICVKTISPCTSGRSSGRDALSPDR